MQKLYNEFFRTCRIFDKFVQEQKWKNVKNRIELKIVVDSEYEFWKRVLSLMPPERRLIKEFSWFKQCYEQIKINLENEKVNWKLRWLQDDEESL